MDESTSTTLIHKAKSQDPDAWQRLVRDYSPTIYNQARSSGLTSDEAADVTQDVLAAVFVSIDRFQREKETDGFRKWLLGVTRNKVRDFFRRARKQLAEGAGGSDAYHRLQQTAAYDLEASSNSHNAADATLLIGRALSIIEADFQPNTWQAFWRTAVEGENAATIAAQLGMKPDAVRKAKARVTERLREELAALFATH